ncbi:hypothetical protein [Mumia sp. Pv 4-285]|uniref:hypothetical protein n=1 Tax=Mumia qirimensis TaxID=3234852 RepID=UPI00351D80E3
MTDPVTTDVAPWVTRRRAAVGLGTALIVVAGSIGAWAYLTAGARINDFEDAGSVARSTHVAGPATMSFSIGPLCVDTADGTVEVTDVVPADRDGGLTVTEFGFVDYISTADGGSESTIGDEEASLSENLRGRRLTATLSSTCDGRDSSPPELVMQIDKTRAGTTGTTGFEVSYRSGHRSHQVFVPFGLWVCEPKVTCPARTWSSISRGGD